MTTYIGMLRAVNVGGTSPLRMADLKAACESTGFGQVQTYLASGNVVFTSPLNEDGASAQLRDALARHCGLAIDVLLRSAAAMTAVAQQNPYSDKAGRLTVAVFLPGPPPADALARATGWSDEEARLGEREIYIHYPSGQGRSKLRIPAAASGTARNMNTVAGLVTMAFAVTGEAGADHRGRLPGGPGAA